MHPEPFKRLIKKTLRRATLCFMVRDNQVLLAMKKRGFGAGLWNGVGGKPLVDETLDQAIAREVKEEIGVAIQDFQQVANLYFLAPDLPSGQKWIDNVVVYLCNHWQGQETESEEMRPQWFMKDSLPFNQMWWDDKYWLPPVLDGQKLTGYFLFDKNQKLLDHLIKENVDVD